MPKKYKIEYECGTQKFVEQHTLDNGATLAQLIEDFYKRNEDKNITSFSLKSEGENND